MKHILEEPRIRKVGRLIESDLKHLQAAVPSFQINHAAAEDIAQLAKQKCVIRSIRNVGLSDLSARVLHKRVNKNVAERSSSWWEDPTLTSEQINYAALDAYASLRICEVLDSLSTPKTVDSLPSISCDIPVMMHASNKRSFAASGTALATSALTSTHASRTLDVRVTKVFCSAANIPGGSNNHPNSSFDDFGPTPFTITYPTSHLVAYQPLDEPPEPMEIVDETPAAASNSQERRSPNTSRVPDILGSDYEPTFSASPSHLHDFLSVHDVDREALALGESIFGTGTPPSSPEWLRTVRSRVIKDAFHAMHMLNIPQTHGLSKDFSRGFSDTVFIPVWKDACQVAAWGARQMPPLTLNEIRRRFRRWFLKHCRRQIPPPEQLYWRLRKFFLAFGPLKDAATGAPLFNEARWKIARNILDLAERGFLSDPPGVPLYTVMGFDQKAGLRVYRCFRGTNTTEGGVHTHLRPNLPSSGVSLRNILAALQDFVLRHNLVVRSASLLNGRCV